MGFEDIASKAGDKAKDVAGKAADGIKDKISDINDDPVGFLQKKGKEAAVDAASNTNTGQKTQEAIKDAKAVAELATDTAAAVAEGGLNVVEDAKVVVDVVANKDTWLRMTKRAIMGAIAGILGACGCLMLPIALAVGTVFIIILVIVGGWGTSCPAHDVPVDTMQRFITYYDAYTQGATEDITIGKYGGTEEYGKTTPEILAAVDYKETNISDEIPVCHNLKTDSPPGCEYIVCDLLGCRRELDTACHFQCNLDAIKCRAGKIRMVLQDNNENKMTPLDIDPSRNIAYLGNFQKADKAASLPSNYEPYNDKYIMENYDSDISRLWQSLKTPSIAESAYKAALALVGITWDRISSFFTGLFGGTVDIGAATFFRLTRPELIPLRPATPGWGDVTTGHIKKFVTYMQSLGAFPGLEKVAFYEYQPGELPTFPTACSVFSSPASGPTPPATPPTTPGTPGTPGTPIPPATPPSTTSWKMPSSVLNKIKSYKSVYVTAAAKYKLPWQLLAAISYRESGLSPAGPSGERIGSVNPDSHKVECTTHTQCEEKIASHLISMADMVYNVNLTASSSQNDIVKAFVAYNRGFMYKRGGCTPTSSPYAMNQFDAAHKDMRWPNNSCEPSSTRGRRNIPAGALTIYSYLVNKGI